MTNQEAIEMLTAKAECIRREASGIDVDCIHRNCDECDLCYKQGTMGDQMKALDMAIQALKREDETRRMLETEKNKAYWRSKDYRSGRISAFYDALGVNYAD